MSLFRITLKNTHAYIWDIVGLNLTFTLRIIVILMLFRAIRELSGTTSFGFSFEAISWAMVFAQVVAVTRTRIGTEIETEVKSGKIALSLLQPVPYVSFKALETLARSFSAVVPSLLIGCTVAWIMVGPPPFAVANVFGSVVLLAGGIVTSFFGYFTVALMAFFLEDIKPLGWMWSKLDMLFGGNILPLPFLPPLIQSIAFFTPFAHSGYSAGLVLHDFSWQKFGTFFLMQLVWISVLWAVCQCVYAFGSRRLEINGG